MRTKRASKALSAGILAASVALASPVSAHATTQTITSSGTPSANIAVTATVSSSFSVQLPMSIELVESDESGSNGPVFASPDTVKIGVKGTLYGKVLTVSVKDGRDESATFGQAGKLTLAQATESGGVYTVADETGAVSADVTLAKSRFFPASTTPTGENEAVIASGTDYTDYDLSIQTTSRITGDTNTLYYGKLTFTVATEDMP